MVTQHLFISGFLSFGSGLSILFLVYRKYIQGFMDKRLWRNHFMPGYPSFHERRNRNKKTGSIIVAGVAALLIISGISTMIHVNGLYNAESKLHKHESEAGHQSESREIRREPTPGPKPSL